MKIKNWREFQHYTGRRPPWIRLYRKLLDDREWHELDGEAAKLLVNLWMLAAETDGELPSPADIAFRLRVSEKNVSAILSRLSHWCEQDASTVLADCKQDATPDKSRGDTEEIRSEEKGVRAASRADRRVRLPVDWLPSEAALKKARELITPDRVDGEVELFRDYWLGCGKPMLDWERTFLGWIRRESKRYRPVINRQPDPILARKLSNAQKMEAVLERLSECAEETSDSPSETPLRLVSVNAGGR